ncbi:hypothetical protein DCAR_0206518 [Daucus carota subsp. sativus]|uniref:Uncharacterized protein n=1 Tax=Daucus carota subsp. sativus TaxID=79200 RepID=A0AAF0WFV6_DAUCS|nr:PREDICTED: uncharacterized protein LOC108208422 isoform X1 [Daucus carota subsp. sativus]WOG87295.1 hypothetical protein DCAR_0206518 [Daucus carota subsp. sativus]
MKLLNFSMLCIVFRNGIYYVSSDKCQCVQKHQEYALRGYTLLLILLFDKVPQLLVRNRHIYSSYRRLEYSVLCDTFAYPVTGKTRKPGRWRGTSNGKTRKPGRWRGTSNGKTRKPGRWRGTSNG